MEANYRKVKVIKKNQYSNYYEKKLKLVWECGYGCFLKCFSCRNALK
jgi:hypothetical protein